MQTLRSTLLAWSLLSFAQGASGQGIFYIYKTSEPILDAGVVHGGASFTTNQYSRAVIDDISVDPIWSGKMVRSITFGVWNSSPLPVTARARISFWRMNGSVVGPTGVPNPGTWIVALGTQTTSYASGLRVFESGLLPFSILTIPVGGKFWAGQNFDGNFPDSVNFIGSGIAFASPSFPSTTDAKFQTHIGGSMNLDITASMGVQSVAPGGQRQYFAFGLPAQNFSVPITLSDVVPSPIIPRSLTVKVSAGTTVLSSEEVITITQAQSTVEVRLPNELPAGLANPVTIEFNGSSFLKRKIQVHLPTPPNSSPQTIPVPTVLLANGDVDNSGAVDAADVDLIIASFGMVVNADTPPNYVDVDASGEVDAADIDIVIANFGAVDE